jgi:hypothetical protein
MTDLELLVPHLNWKLDLTIKGRTFIDRWLPSVQNEDLDLSFGDSVIQ